MIRRGPPSCQHRAVPPLLVGLRPDHRLAGRDTVALADLARDILGISPASLFPAWALCERQALETAGISPPVIDLAGTDLAAAGWAGSPASTGSC
jgi:hypothetical protein